MREVIERRDERRIVYDVLDDETQTAVTVGVTSRRVLLDGIAVTVFYDRDWNLLEDPSVFMLREMRYESENTQLQAAGLLRLMFSYARIIGVAPERFDLSEARGFMSFLRGSLGEGVSYRWRLTSTRSEQTIANYLQTARHYMRFMGAKDSPFLEKSILRWGLPDEETSEKGFRLSAKVVQPFEAPRYISIAEYKRLRSNLDDDIRMMEDLAIRLMFERGLRLGEVLGLTIEDIQSHKAKDGMTRMYCLKIRNRVSDRPDQKAKTAMKVNTVGQYESRDYRTCNVGYQEAYISSDLYREIVEYIEQSRQAFPEAGRTAKADSVEHGEPNQYVFLNRLGRPMSANLWNKRLRAIFIRSGLIVDEGTRKTNLSHRLRHGYAMMLTRNLGLDPYRVKVLMRHRNVQSTQVYHRPTADDVNELQNKLTGQLQRLIMGDDHE